VGVGAQARQLTTSWQEFFPKQKEQV
jgi:hypothetical protein